jgi:asparagine synthase (glutamine-hydrolysing)
MSGICAVLGSNAEQLVRKMCNSLRHRGPDDEGIFIDKNLALGHTSLQTADIPVPHQPLANEDRTIWITFDGEIYNKEQLIKQLEKNHTFDTNSSAEVVAHSYEEDGPSCVNRFNGMFAFSLWDSAKAKLFCARDRFGMKPFYYCDCPPMFVQASEIKALLTVPSVPKKPNDPIVYDYLMTAHNDHTEDTFFTGIKRLLPAHHMFVDHTGVKIRRYWNPTRALRTDQLAKEDQSYASELRELLQDSVRITLPADLPVGTFLSGGLDSTSIAYLVNDILNSTPSARTQNGEGQELFSAIYREPLEQGDERPYIEEIVHALKTKANYVSPSVAGRWKDITQFIYYVDEPVAVFNYYAFWCLSRKAREKVRVVFYGHGTGILGELESVEEYTRYFRELWRRKRIARLLLEMVGALPRVTISSIKTVTVIWNRSGKSRIEGLLAPQFAARFIREARIENFSLRSEYSHWIAGNLVDCLRVSDLVSSAFSLEPRYPFLDPRIVEFALSLPTTQKVRKGWSKYVLRNAMKSVIPDAVRKSRKHFGTPVPLERWMRQLRPNIRELFESSKFRQRGYFNQPAILDAYDRFCEGKMDRFTSAYYAEAFWRILNLELWLETFFDPESEIHNEGLEDRSR